jgi:serine phosphatase RsbU (regulator of sigma subunit)
VRDAGGAPCVWVFDTASWSARLVPVPGARSVAGLEWSSDGSSLCFKARGRRGRLDDLPWLWRRGKGEARPLPVPEGLEYRGFCWLSRDSLLLLLRETGGSSAGRFFQFSVSDPAGCADVTGELPPSVAPRALSNAALDPGLLFIWGWDATRREVRSYLARIGLAEPVRILPKSFRSLPRWRADGKTLCWVEKDGEGLALVCLELPALSERRSTVCPAADWAAPLLHPEGLWEGMERSRAMPRTLLGFPREEWSVLGRGCEPLLRNITVLSAPGPRLEERLALLDRYYRPGGPSSWIGTAGRWRLLVEAGSGGLFPRYAFWDPLAAKSEPLHLGLEPSQLGSSLALACWAGLLVALLNTALFLALALGRSGASGAFHLGLFFWAIGWGGVPAVPLVSARLILWPSAGHFLILEHLAVGLGLALMALSLVPRFTLRFATGFPSPNAFKTRYPRAVRFSGAVTLLFPAFVAALLVASILLLHGASGPDAGGQSENPVTMRLLGILGMGGFFLLLLSGVIFVLSLAALIHNFRFAPSPKVRSQLRYVALGFGGMLAWLTLGWIPLSFLGARVGETAGVIGVAVLFLLPGLFCGYAFLSGQLLDLSFVVRRTVKYAALLVILGCLFLGVVSLLGVLLPAFLGWESQVAVALASAATVLAFQPVRRRVQDWVDRRFDRVRYDAKKTLGEISGRLATMGSVEQVRDALEGAARDILRVSESRLLFFERGQIAPGAETPSAEPETADLADLAKADLPALLSVDRPWVRLAVPVAQEGHAFAVLALGEKLSQEKYSPEDREFLRILADGAGMALQNLCLVREATRGEVYKKDLEEARAIQARYFPKVLPAIPGYGLAASTAPARLVGGDYYDVIPLPEGRLALLVADVSGKGMPAALRVAEVRSYLHACAELEADPGGILTRMNRYLCGPAHANEFTTAALGVLEPASGEVAWAIAGHLPPFRVRPGGNYGEVAFGGSLPLGCDPSEAYETGVLTLSSGEALVFLSDGLPERKDEGGRLLGFEAVGDLLSGIQPGESARAILERLLDLGESFAAGRPAEDDVTVMVVKREGP